MQRDLGLYEELMKEHPVLSRKEEIALAKRVEKGDSQAREEFIYSNLRLVSSIAGKYVGGDRFLDVVDDGIIGLMRAVSDYDYRRGRFSSYATNWIKHEILRQFNRRGGIIRLPSGARSLIQKIRKIRLNYFLERGSEPSYKEIRKRLNKITGRNSPVRYIRDLMQTDPSTLVSLDEVVGDNGEESRLVEFVEDKKSRDVADSVFILELVREFLARLKGRELEIIKLRHGLADGRSRIQEEVGRILGLTKGGVSFYEKSAFEKLKPLAVKHCKEVLGANLY